MINLVVYMALIAVGFYFGKWLGAVGLVAIYFFYFHSRQLAKQQQRQSSRSTNHMPRVDLAWAYQVLGVSQSADAQTIKQARKKLLNHYHPDKLGHVTESEKQAAEHKVNDINRAFQAIKQAKGF